MRRLKAGTKNKNLNLLIICALSTVLLSLMSTSLTFAQKSVQNPWGLFQTLCPAGRLATGPQCANLFTGTNVGTCDSNLLITYGVCIPTMTGTCPSNYQLQNGVCVPLTNTCPSGTVLQNSVCVPITITCPIGSILQNGICVPLTNPVQSAPVAVPTVSPSSTVVGNTFVTLNGLGSYATTSGATIVSYSWVQTSGPTVSLTGANTATPTFQAPIVVNLISIAFSLTVTDSLGQVSAPVSVTVTVTPS
jgi:K319-like protein